MNGKRSDAKRIARRNASATSAVTVWPSAGYARQIARLRRAIGQPVHIVELTYNGLSIGAVYHSEPHVLLAVVPYPRPDPAQGLYPHMLILDDGRGVNLGRIARVSRNHAFEPAPADVLYGDRLLQGKLLYGPRRLSRRHIARVAREQLGRLLDKPADRPECAAIGLTRRTPRKRSRD